MPATTAEIFARRLRQERDGRGFSQVDLAHRLSDLMGIAIYPTTITKIEKQERSVKLEEAVAIAEVLGVPLAALLVDRDALGEEIARVREDLLVTEHARLNALSRVEEFASKAKQLRRHVQELEALGGH